MKKILFVLDTLKIGGAEKSTLYIASQLKTIDATVCTIYPGDFLSDDPAFKDVKIVKLNSDKKYGFFKNAKRLRAVIDELRPDLVVSSIFKADIVTRLSLLGADIPLLGTFINDEYPMVRLRAGNLKNKAFVIWCYVWDFLTIRRVNHVVSNSVAIKQSNAKKLRYPNDKVSVIYRGRPIPPHVPSSKVSELGKLTFLNVGRLIERKGQLELIQAFQRALHEYPDIRLKIAGDGHFRPALEHAIANGGGEHAIQLLGHVSNVDELLRQSDVFVLPSHYEGFSGALVEAMVAGKLIICSDIAMNTEAITDGINGMVFECQNVDALYATLINAIENYPELQGLGENARAFAEEHLNMDSAAEKYEELYLSLMK